jgi:hypothetical protein
MLVFNRKSSIIFSLNKHLIVEMNVSFGLVLEVSRNNCKSESVQLLQEVMPKVTNGQNSCTGWASACIKGQQK